jgi:hypothetical protein
MIRFGRGSLACAGAAFVVLACAASAAATVRYASPTGTGTVCSQASPCSVVTATTDPTVGGGDEAVLAPGAYQLTSNLFIDKAITVHGASGQSRPLIDTGDDRVVLADPGLTLAGIDLVGHFASTLTLVSGTADGLRVVNDEALISHATACEANNTTQAFIRNSVCWQSAAETGAGIKVSTSVGSNLAVLRNVTAVASGSAGHGIYASIAPSGQITVDGRNVIASGPEYDLYADGSGGDSISILLVSSNFDTALADGIDATTSAPGSGTNQTVSPLFANAATGDFHQLAGSPTIDAGGTDSLLGSFDLDGEARVQGAAPDIGADEFTVAVPDTTAPETTIKRQPKKKSSKAKAKLTFTADDPAATFECKLDKAGYKSCDSPFKKKVKHGKHKFQVRATDAAGNTEQTPAKAKWKVIG